MNKKEILNKYHIKVKSYKKLRNADIVKTDDKYWVIKKANNHNIYEYLRNRNFHNFPHAITESQDDYEIVEYIDSIKIPEEQQIEDLIYLVSILHTKTTFYKTIDTDYIKELYEETLKKQEHLYYYYLGLQDMIESEVYMSPSHYLLIRNISNIYKCIYQSKEYLEEWYHLIKDQKKIRYAMTHGNLDKSHLLENNEMYLISWNKARVNIPIYDLVNLYVNNYHKIDIVDLLNIYEMKYQLSKEEKYLFFSIVMIPPKLEIQNTEYLQVKEVFEIVEYVDKLKATYINLENYKNSVPYEN
ncbi:MAG: hypothetical protein PUB18_01560 [bacterium]|nr:hypothetical protein [bacterium]